MPRTWVSLSVRSIPYLQQFGWELPDLSSHNEVHQCFIALFHRKQLWDLHVSASAYFPAHQLSHSFPEGVLMVCPPAAMAEEGLPRWFCSHDLPLWIRRERWKWNEVGSTEKYIVSIKSKWKEWQAPGSFYSGWILPHKAADCRGLQLSRDWQ